MKPFTVASYILYSLKATKELTEKIMAQEMEQCQWGIGSILMMLIMVICLLFLPLFLGSVQPPSLFVLLVFPLAMVVIWIYLSYASKSDE